MSEHRRRSSNSGGGEEPPEGQHGGQPYAYGTPPQGTPSYDTPGRPRAGRPGAPGGPRGVRQTSQQPRLTRAEMRKATQKGGRKGAGDPAGGAAKPPGKKRFIDYPRWGKSGVRRWLPSWRQCLTIFLVFFGSGVAAIGVTYAMTVIPNANDLIKDQNSIYYWADGSEMTRKGDTNRQIVPLSQISPNVQNAVIAAENETFKTDSGIDPQGIARAVYNMATGGPTQGGSTITQQYVKNAYLSQDQTLSRKLSEFFITLKINQKLSKDQILEGYLNTSYFGRGSGIQAAAQAYYGVNASDLNVCQSAMLAGLLKGAADYDPSLSKANLVRETARWNYVLDRMVVGHTLSAADRAKCNVFPMPIPNKTATAMNGEIGYLVDTANKYMEAQDPTITDASLAIGGYRIYTTFQKDKVDELKAAVDQISAANLDPAKRPTTDTNVQVGAASVVPGDGAIVAIYGGPGYDQNHFVNNADASGVPVGSTFKPFVLATAMQVGVLTQTGADGKPTRINEDSRYSGADMSTIRKPDGSLVLDANNKPFRQKNDDPGDPGFVTLRKAMEQSMNVPYVQLGEDVGGTNVMALAEKMGLKKESFSDPNTASFAIGTSTPSAIRMASAYSVFAARGQQTDPYSVTKVELNGVARPAFTKPTPKPVLDQAVADNITDVLQGVVLRGTGTKAQAVGRPIAGKTGTTDKGVSAWFDGYTPQLATAVSMFREDPSNPALLSLTGTGGAVGGFYGGNLPTEIFAQYMKAALANTPVVDFPAPEPINTEVDSSGAPSTASPSPSTSATNTATAPTSAPAAPVTSAPSQPQPGDSGTVTGSPSAPSSPGASCDPAQSLFGCGPTGFPPPSKPGHGHSSPPPPTGGGTAPASPGGGLLN
ncbi:membrane peptidoglycan carboxypeptidase [Kitasatospora sp. MAP12-15]|uniref:transglycosylase domain-containing protein n=1 Tax=unclassified Kitasatospora TaxID=2633591 RepID=UPI00247715BC|nr:transglycosylase domain-containing protein [Kitasatospora sp. MAP12-44]MDH6111868.1 membrane peptidoglycan carboxypeptidase [Kitasatospora sp. MAP12-44]